MRTSQLTLHDITKTYGDQIVLDRASLTIKPGEKVGVIGDNGSGKSTLLRIVAGQESLDGGEMTVRAPGGIGYLAQTLDLLYDATVQDAVDLALTDLRELEARMREAEARLDTSHAAKTYAALIEQYEARGGYEADTRVGIALHGLGLPYLEPSRRLGTLSGGERARLALAATLASQPELLLLDEPTNDLDDQAVGWLEAHLRAHRGTVVAVTHDRVFLERLTTTIVEVEAGRVSQYGDGYDGYLAAKLAQRRRRMKEYDDWRDELARNKRVAASNVARLDAIPRKAPLSVFGHGGFRARGRGHGAMVRIRNAKERVERLTAAPVTPPPDPLVLTARVTTGSAARGGEPAAQLTGVHVGNRLNVPFLLIQPTERLLVTGPNGAGKSTLMRVLAGELRPDGGAVRVPGRVGHLRQEGTHWAPELTVVQAFGQGRPGDADEHAETLLSLGLFSPADLRRRVGELSYGQRRRIELARLVSEPVDLLLLDEPTNHLSPALVEELEEALIGYQGALVIVTHDRRMRSRFAGSHLVLREGRIGTGAAQPSVGAAGAA
ncbi:TlrC/CarA/OleB/SrmB family ABC-F type ribosomal protection protein [Nonomuraea sp. NPDC050536]|uniref:TlrC/CarA/OleB/SrmB family ABC-F type ribosomal protection protein n=1 Tax=Nonomuraea sp. NPDC050536 TaxID=3364366 RepID=UPI0037CA3F9A